MKVYDCFTFYNELDLLEIRLNELYDDVDYFVLVESKKTFQNNPKPLYYFENLNRFTKFNSKIIRLEIPEYHFTNSTWVNEAKSWNYLINGLNEAKDEDIIMISALDEIPKKETLQLVKNNSIFPCCVVMDLYYFYLNTKYLENGSTEWNGTYITKFNMLDQNNMYSFNTKRKNVHKFYGGWHFSFLGDAKHAFEKVHSYSHSEFNNFTEEHYKTCISNLSDVFGRSNVNFFGSYTDISELPKYVLNNIDKFKKYIRS